MKTANVIGATGLVGSALVSLLLKDSRFDKVKVFARHTTGIVDNKLEEHIVNFDDPDGWKKKITGDVLYSTLGTTLRDAGSKDAQYKIDYTYQYQAAKAAAANDVKEYVLISAAGSNPNSGIFYSKMKGELEQAVSKLPFETIHIIRPGMLAGERKKVRTGEVIGIAIMKFVGSMPGLRNMRPVEGWKVAKAMINATFRNVIGIHRYNMGEVFKLAKMSV